jgi:hypothetical protein
MRLYTLAGAPHGSHSSGTRHRPSSLLVDNALYESPWRSRL